MTTYPDLNSLEFKKGDLVFISPNYEKVLRLMLDPFSAISWLMPSRRTDDVFPCPKYSECSACGEVHRP